MQAAPSFVHGAAQWLCKTPVRVSQARPPQTPSSTFEPAPNASMLGHQGPGMAAVAVHSSRGMPTATAAATVESELSPTTPVCSPLHDGSLRLHPMTMCCICTTVSLQSVSGRGRGAKTDLEQTMRRTPPSVPYLWIAGLSTSTSAESETLLSRYLQTG
jgi:hypothetical protein